MKSRAETLASIEAKSRTVLAEEKKRKSNILKVSLTAACFAVVLPVVVSAFLTDMPKMSETGYCNEDQCQDFSYGAGVDEKDNFMVGIQGDVMSTEVLVDGMPDRVVVVEVSSMARYELTDDEAAELCELLNGLERSPADEMSSDPEYSITLEYVDRSRVIGVYDDAVAICDGEDVLTFNCEREQCKSIREYVCGFFKKIK